ncbi:MAG: nucleoside-diphosphate sugar epimerase/dehydratase [Saprospiraceae bacterium]|nr:nucleoside-diphosphate sugar epimerase/dehydratase [Saprospiraceae bacterium]
MDLLLALFSWFWASFLLFGFDWGPTAHFLAAWPTVVVLLCRALAFYGFRTYRVIFRYVGEKDYKTVFMAISVSSLVIFIVYWLLFPDKHGYRGLAIVYVDYFFLLALLGSQRIAMRLVYDRLKEQRQRVSGKPTVIFGAGELGTMLERVLAHNTQHDYRVVAFFDDNPMLHRKQMNGIPIFNPDRSFDRVVKKYGVQTVIMGVRELSAERRVAFIDRCLNNSLHVLKPPPTELWLNGALQVGQLSQVNLEDLLSRPPIRLDDAVLSDAIAGKVVLVTGCAGSIGSEIVRQLLRHRPARVVGIDQAETPLAEIALALRAEVSAGLFTPVLADVRDVERMHRLFGAHRPAWVFHAAAYKHVPIMELAPEEAVKANVQGTCVVADLAVAFRAEKFVMVSTDKAVNPANVMGASKRIAEMYVQALNFAGNHHTQFITTRFGNVLGSNGSVIPIFREQIEHRRPVTITHPDIKRYFMTIPEACRLVLEAGAIGLGGEIFVFDMGEQVRILDLAHRMIQLAGLVPGRDIDIQFTGLRPGEKLYEELLDHKENLAETHHPKIFRARVRPSRLDDIRVDIDTLIYAAANGTPDHDLVQHMKNLVPEFRSHNSAFSSLDK